LPLILHATLRGDGCSYHPNERALSRRIDLHLGAVRDGFGDVRSNPEIIVKVCSPLPMPGCLQVGPVKSMDNEGGKWRIPASKSMARCAPVGSSECLAPIL
jgi:hypothetical protein